MHLVDSANTFTKQELERLAAYRGAVAAGVYTDWDGSTGAADTEVLAWLRAADGVATPGAYPFTVEERERLEGCRAAVASGAYADDRPPVDAGATPAKPER
ncbi:MAG TPA: hypothetical protein VKV73_10835 [Chloroflexota bacterium]|nr:hypothetical protein [Chloroflexota bacterium]